MRSHSFLRAIPALGAIILLLSNSPAHAAGKARPEGLLPPVPVPADNPQTSAKIKLGTQLFFDTRLSADNTISCGTCHDPRTGYANPHATDTGIKGQVGGRNSGTVINAAYMRYQFWDGRAQSLEEQALGPIANPVEMGETVENVVRKLNAIPGYKQQFQAVFHTDVTADGIAKAIAAFERSVVSGRSPYDRWLDGDKGAMSAAAVRGERLFNGKALCATCHAGPEFSDQSFHNLGVGMDAANPDLGRFAVTKKNSDRGSFKTPGLRNVALTPPYMHDGKEKTLLAVVQYYEKGGTPNSNLDPMLTPIRLTEQERQDLVAFMEALTGSVPGVQVPKFPAGPGPAADPKGGLR